MLDLVKIAGFSAIFRATTRIPYNAMMNQSSNSPDENRRFATTQWSCVIEATGQDSARSRPALEKLCRIYWYPLYALVRRKGHNASESADLTQGFFLHLLEGNRLDICDQTRGKFRSFLSKAITHFITSQWRMQSAQKRGGGHKILQIDFESADQRFKNEPVDHLTPEKLFDRRWALSILDQTMNELRADFQSRGKAGQFDALQSQIGGDGAESYLEISQRLGITEGAVKVAVHRLRDRYRKKLRQVVAETLDLSGSDTDPSDLVDQEIKELFATLN